MNILITGGNGYIAKALFKSLREFHYVHLITRDDFDLTDREATNAWFKDKHYSVVIHTAIKGGSRLEKDNSKVFYQNIQMFYNLLNNKKSFNKLISFGSGAETGYPSDPYGLSKNIISRIIKEEYNFFNIRIYGVFDENELDTRFIKSNIKRYINKQPLEIHENKYMDFFYMEDLIKLVDYYMNEPNPLKLSSCSYHKKYTLLDIAQIINSLNNHKCDIKINSKDTGKSYSGISNIDLDFIGIEEGIKRTYNKLK